MCIRDRWIGICHHVIVVEVFIGQSAKAMPELMYHNGAEHGMVGGSKGIGIIAVSYTHLDVYKRQF